MENLSRYVDFQWISPGAKLKKDHGNDNEYKKLPMTEKLIIRFFIDY